MNPKRVCNVQKCPIPDHQRKSWQFPLKGGPYDYIKYRLSEPLPKRLELNGSVYFLTELPERKRWPLMYVYDEERSIDHHSIGRSRTARAQLIAKAALFGTQHWYRY